jgi:oxygen-dependent protoporphyrinogen oxidase
MTSVAVIGGGITGLTAAWRLHRQNIPVTLYEASGRVGGVIKTVAQNGFLAECGPNTILETSAPVKSLVEDLGLADRRMYADSAAKARSIVRYGRPSPLPSSRLAFLGTRLFSLRAKFSVVQEPFRKPQRPESDESLAAFVRRRLGDEFLEYAINPFVAGVYAGDPARLSVRHAFPKLDALEERYGSLIKGQIRGARERRARGEISKQSAPMFSFDSGLQLLTDTLRDELHGCIRLGTRVVALRREEEWKLDFIDDGYRDERTHSAVILAIPAHQASLLELHTPGAEHLRDLHEIYYPPVATVALGFRREDVTHPLDGFGMLIPEKEEFNILGTFFSSSLFPNRAPERHVTLTSFVGGVRAPHLAASDAQDLVDTTRKDLRKLLGVTGNPVFEHVAVYREAIPQYEVGYRRFKDLLTNIEDNAPGLLFAGQFRDGISVADCITSGDKAAARIQAALEASEPEIAGAARL